MGNTKWYETHRKTKKNEYETVCMIDGVKVVRRIGSGNTGTPMYSNTSEMYATYNIKTGMIKQISCYNKDTHVKMYDIDWDHDHDGFKKGEPHVQYYHDKVRQSGKAYPPNEKQMRLYLQFKDKKVDSKWLT